MERNFTQAITNRRSYYQIGNNSPVEDAAIENILRTALQHVPSAFNSQSARFVLLLGQQHLKLWNIVKVKLKEITSEEQYRQSEKKIDNCFASGYGTVLFFEDQTVIEELQANLPKYAENFNVWSLQASGMHQFVVWTMLEDAGFGASLQHYNPIIDGDVIREWDLNPKWKLIAQMPFGTALAQPQEKDMAPLDDRMLIFK